MGETEAEGDKEEEGETKTEGETETEGDSETGGGTETEGDSETEGDNSCMSNDTRSKTTLPGNIKQYIMSSSTTSTTMLDTPPRTETLDMQTLLTMMRTTMGAMSELRITVGNNTRWLYPYFIQNQNMP